MNRYRAAATACLIAILPAVSGAQDTPNKTWGAVFGLNVTTMGGADAEAQGYKNRTGFIVGMQSQREIKGGSRFIRSGIVISRRGGYQADTAGNKQWLKLTYAEVPLLVGYNFIRRPGLKAYALGGLQAGLKLGCSFDYNTGGTKIHLPCSDPTLDFKAKTFDFAGIAGGGLSFPRETGTLHLTAQYAWGFSSINRDSPALDLKNRGATFIVSWLVERKSRM